MKNRPPNKIWGPKDKRLVPKKASAKPKEPPPKQRGFWQSRNAT